MISLKVERTKKPKGKEPQDRRSGLGGALAGTPDPGRSDSPGPEEELEEESAGPGRRFRMSSRRGQQEPEGTGGTNWSGSSNLASQAMLGLLIAGLVAGPVALFLEMTEDPPVAVGKSDDGAQAGTTVETSSIAGERGLQTVNSWMASTQETQLIRNASRDVKWPKSATSFENARVAQVTPAEKGNGRWQVIVAGTVPGSGEVFFAVPVQVDRGKATALELPSVVPDPAQSSKTPDTVYEQDDLPLDAPLATTVTDFLGAYLTGEETTRFTSPDARIAAVSGSPWDQVKLTRVDADLDSGADATSTRPAEGEEAKVLATYQMQRGNDATTSVPSSMSLTLTARGGRWEVTSVDPTPKLDGSSPKKTTSPTGEANTK